MDDQYELGALLGAGGMGEVHIARHRSRRLVAIKQVLKALATDRFHLDRLTDETRLLARIDHPNVVQALDGGTDADGQPFLVMSRAYGNTLGSLIADDGPMSRARITAIVSQLLDGLIAIHDARVIHADLKSSNVLVDELDRVTIIDFGLARTVTRDMNDDSIFAGTPAYMAPEVMTGERPTLAADIFATGVIVYELLTGSTPLPSCLPPTVMLALRMTDPVEPPSRRAPSRRITEALDGVVLRALDRQPEARFPTVRAFANALAEALAGWESNPDETDARHVSSLASRAPTKLAIEPPTIVSEHGTDRFITAALGSAKTRVAARDVEGAIVVLEQALEHLASMAPELASPIVATAWRLETVLAVLYKSVGKTDHARRLANVAYQHALRTGCRVARARAGEVLGQVSRRRRFARGSNS